MQLQQMNIKDFRHLKDVVIKFGNNITVISGFNGTGKSSILGLTGHLFSYRYNNKDNPKERYPYKTISGQPYETDYSEIFRFCEEHDMSKRYDYNLQFINDNDETEYLYAHSEYVTAEDRFRVYVGQKENQHGKKYTAPVIYLGLKRLYPVVEEIKERLLIDRSELTPKETKEFISFTKNVLVSLDDAVSSNKVVTNHKKYEAIKTENYNVKGLSAGQDNVSQIITSLLSFKRLGNLKGGILLVDEIDATLFPAAQINLIKKLYQYSKKLNIQIVFTTHSLEIIGLLQEMFDSEDCVINFLECKDKKVKNSINPSFEYIKNRILLQTQQKEEIEKVNLLCEDNTAYNWIQNLLKGNSFLKQRCNVYPGNLSHGALADLASRKLACFDDFIFVIDGDQRGEQRYKKIKNVMFVPGTKSPDSEIFLYLYSLDEKDAFWENEHLFCKDTCFNGYIDEMNENRHKQWLNENGKYLGRNYCKFFNRWKKDNEEKIQEFQSALEKLVRGKLRLD